MDWMEKVNQAIGYVENHLTEEIDLEEISRITLCPAALFQRFFVLTAGITLTEYIRRRLSCAAPGSGESPEKNHRSGVPIRL